MAYSKKTDTPVQTQAYNIDIVKASVIDSKKVSFAMSINGIIIYDCWLNERTRKDGTTFEVVSLPSRKGSDGNYYAYVYIPLRELSDEIIRQVKALI